MASNDQQSDRPTGGGSTSDETRQRILLAAAGLFAQEGYARVTTRSVAAAANVNEVTIFRHFGGKQNLFASVIQQIGGPAVAVELAAQLTGEYHQDMLTIGNRLMQLLLERKDAMRLMLCESSHFPEVQAAMAQNPRQLRQMLATYFQQQIDQGRVRRLHPEAMAQAFLGMFFTFAILQVFLGDAVDPQVETEELVAQFVDIFVRGTVE